MADSYVGNYIYIFTIVLIIEIYKCKVVPGPFLHAVQALDQLSY